MLLVQLHEVVPDGIERDHMGVVLEFLRKGVREPGEAAHLHSHREVLALGVGCADVLPVGAALDRHLERADAV